MASKDISEVMNTFTFDKDNKESEGSFVNQNGLKIYCKYWSKDLPAPRALLFMCHGLAEHVGPYTQLAELLTAQNFFVFGHDHQGHGQSEGDRIHIDDFRHYSRDVFAHIDKMKVYFPTLPVYILGHSMGGAITIIAALDRPDYFKGVVLIGPVVTDDQEEVGPVLAFVGKIIARIFPQCPIISLDTKYISRDPKVVEAYKNDKLNYHGRCKAKWAVCINKAMIEIESKLHTIKWPFLTTHGECDGLVMCVASKKLYEKAASEDKTLTLKNIEKGALTFSGKLRSSKFFLKEESEDIYPGAYHQLHLEIEPDGSRARQEIVDWLVKHEQQ